MESSGGASFWVTQQQQLQNSMKRLISLFIIMIIPVGMTAQEMICGRDSLLNNFSFQVRQIGEFMSRLNGRTSISGSSGSLSRMIDLTSLFMEDTYFQNREYTEDFIQKALARQTYIEFQDSTWYAIARCTVESAIKKDTEITLILKTEEYGEGMYKWVIVDAWGELLDLTPEKRNPGLKISPTDNEVNFISLSHITETEQKNILNYARQNYEPDRLTVLNTLLYNGFISISHVKKLSYVFTDIAGYRLRIDNYPGEARNCGWLISEIHPTIRKIDRMNISSTLSIQ